MAIITMITAMKKIHPTDIIFVKIGNKSKLEENKINYLIVDRRNNYDVNETCDFKNINNKDTKKLLNDIERLINERRKVQSN